MSLRGRRGDRGNPPWRSHSERSEESLFMNISQNYQYFFTPKEYMIIESQGETKMSQNDFIKLEYNVFSKLDTNTVLNVINGGITKELRSYAESHNYEITESDLLKTVYNKLYPRLPEGN